jgi:hypothetical protein
MTQLFSRRIRVMSSSPPRGCQYPVRISPPAPRNDGARIVPGTTFTADLER